MEMSSKSGFTGKVVVYRYNGHNIIRLENAPGRDGYRDFSFRRNGSWVQVAGKDRLDLTGPQAELFLSLGHAWD